MIFTPKTLIRLLPIIFFCSYTYGQVSEKKDKKLDSLHQLVRQADPQEKIDILLELSLYYSKIDTENLDSIRYYANQALVLSKKYENTEEKKVEAIISLCYAEIYAGDFEKALPYAQEALSLAEQLDHGASLQSSNKAMGRLLIDQGNYTEGLYHYNKAYEIAKTHNASISSIIDLAIDLSTEYLLLEYTEEASNLLVDATKLIDDPSVSLESKGIFYTNLGAINEANNNLEKAIEYYNESIKYYERDRNIAFQLAPMQNIANIYSNMHQYQKAIDIFHKKLELSHIERADYGSTFYGLGYNYMQIGDYENAQKYLEKSQEYYISNQ